MATPNYGYEKRQKELAKKRKKEEKLKRKSEPRPDGSDDDTVSPDDAAPGDVTTSTGDTPGSAG